MNFATLVRLAKWMANLSALAPALIMTIVFGDVTSALEWLLLLLFSFPPLCIDPGKRVWEAEAGGGMEEGDE